MDAGLTLISTGLALATLCALHGTARAWLAAPTEDRRHRDRPPAPLRLLWPAVRIAAHWSGPHIPIGWRERTARRLQQAELDLAATPQQWLAGAVLLALLMPVLLGGAAAALAPPLAQTATVIGFTLGAAWAPLWLRDEIARRRRAILRELPLYLDVITLGVECGCGLAGAIAVAVEKAPPSPLRRALQRFLREVRAGRTRVDALRSLETYLDMPAVTALTSALVQAESAGSSLGTALRAQAEQRSQERFARAEKLAMEAPVKLLAPLILCIFPCTFIVLGFPVVVRLLEGM